MAYLLSGTEESARLLPKLRNAIQSLTVEPHLTVIIIGTYAPSLVYVQKKQDIAQSLGIKTTRIALPESTPTSDIIACIRTLNDDPNVHGILVQLPLPSHNNTHTIINTIAPHKDVDGLTAINQGLLMQSSPQAIPPATPQGCLHLLSLCHKSLTGKNALIIGRSCLVGSPLIPMLLHKNMTVTTAHSHTRNLTELCMKADVIIAAAGKPHLVTHAAPTSCLIDVGITYTEDGLKGDIAPTTPCMARSPVPGGVGPMTLYYVMKNVVMCAQRAQQKATP